MAMPRRVNSGPIGGMGGIFGGWGRGDQHREASAAPPWPDHVLNSEQMLARALWQIDHNRSPLALSDLASRPAYGKLIWNMRVEGLNRRVSAIQRITGLPTAADPTDTTLDFKTRNILRAAWDNLNLPPPWTIANNGIAEFRDRLSQQVGMTVFAWIMTMPDGAPPCLIYDLASEQRYWWEVNGRWRQPRMATLQAAMCLGALLLDWDTIRSPEYTGDPIVPPNPARFNRAITVPLHTFMLALLGLGEWCPPHFGCPCNDVKLQIHETVRAAAETMQHGDNTDMLPPFPYEPPQSPPQTRAYTPSRPINRSAPIVPPHHADHAQRTPILPGSDDAIPDETPMSDQESDGWGRGV